MDNIITTSKKEAVALIPQKPQTQKLKVLKKLASLLVLPELRLLMMNVSSLPIILHTFFVDVSLRKTGKVFVLKGRNFLFVKMFVEPSLMDV